MSVNTSYSNRDKEKKIMGKNKREVAAAAAAYFLDRYHSPWDSKRSSNRTGDPTKGSKRNCSDLQQRAVAARMN